MITERTWTARNGAAEKEVFVQAICDSIRYQVWVDVDGCPIAFKKQKDIRNDLRNGSVVAEFDAHGCHYLVKISLAGDHKWAGWNGYARYLALYSEECPGEAIRPTEKYQVQNFHRWTVDWNHTLHFVRAICAEGDIRVLFDGREITNPETRTKVKQNAVAKFDNLHGHPLEVKLVPRFGGTCKHLILFVDVEKVEPCLQNPLSPLAVCTPPPPPLTPGTQTFAQILADVEEGKNSDSLNVLLAKLLEQVAHIHEFKLVYTVTNMSFKNRWIDEDKRRSTITRIFERAASEDFYYDQESKVASRLSMAFEKALSDGIISEIKKKELDLELSKHNVFASEKFKRLEETLVQHGKLLNSLKASVRHIDNKIKLKSKSTLVVRSICVVIPIVGAMVGSLVADLATSWTEGIAGDVLEALDAIFDFSDLAAVKKAVSGHLKGTLSEKINGATTTYLTELLENHGKKLAQDPALAAWEVSHSLNSTAELLEDEQQTHLLQVLSHHSATSNHSEGLLLAQQTEESEASLSTTADPSGLCLNRTMSPVHQVDSSCFKEQEHVVSPAQHQTLFPSKLY